MGKGNSPLCSNANECNRVSCSYGTGVAICAGTSQYCPSAERTGLLVSKAYNQCGYEKFHEGSYVPAMQVWEGDGNNIIIKGGYDC